MTRRDRRREARFMLDATRSAPLIERAAFVRAVSVRLADGEKLYGDRWARTPFGDLLAELVEEALDLGAWAVLAEQRLEMELTPGDRERQREALAQAIRCGAQAFAALTGEGVRGGTAGS